MDSSSKYEAFCALPPTPNYIKYSWLGGKPQVTTSILST